jgi:hypothetical protein
MTASDACEFVMPFGKYRGKALRDIAIDDPDGARYLDWAVGLGDLHPATKDAIKTFLSLPWVAKLVDEAIEGKEYDEPTENRNEPRPWWDKG